MPRPRHSITSVRGGRTRRTCRVWPPGSTFLPGRPRWLIRIFVCRAGASTKEDEKTMASSEKRWVAVNIDAPALDVNIDQVIETNIIRHVEVQDQSGYWCRIHIRRYDRTDRKSDGATFSLVDIEALKHDVGEAERARAQAEQANRMNDEFLATVSHELRTPLPAMLLYAQ